MAKKFIVKREFKKFLISFVFTNICLIYYSSGLFQNSLIDGLKNTFTYNNILTVFIAFGIYLIGYLLFNIIFVFIKYVIKKTSYKISPVAITSLIISIILILFFLNDQLIINEVKSYPMFGDFKPHNAPESNIDSTNFNHFDWVKESIEFYDGEYLEKEKIIFTANNSFRLTGSRIKIDRFYLFRKLFNVLDDYEIKGEYIYENSIYVVDSLHHIYSIQIRKNILYLNTLLSDAI